MISKLSKKKPTKPKHFKGNSLLLKQKKTENEETKLNQTSFVFNTNKTIIKVNVKKEVNCNHNSLFMHNNFFSATNRRVGAYNKKKNSSDDAFNLICSNIKQKNEKFKQ